MRLSCFLLLAGLAGCAGHELSTRDYEAIRDARAAALTARGTPESLATASVMLGFKQNSESLALINRAAALAPRSAEIFYLRWRACARRQCPQEAQYIADLQAIDPGNGMTRLPELSAALDRQDQSAVTRVLETIGASRGLDIYWNKTVVMMVDALGPKLDLAERMVTTTGLLAALSIPPMQPLGEACRTAQFDEHGRLSACEAMASRLQQSDTMMMQGLGLSIEARCWPEGSPQHERLQAQRQQYDYVTRAASRERILHLNADWATRLDAMRKNASEAAAMQAVLISHHEPLERPLNWKDPYRRSQ
jgi:hypothetical protein